MNRSTERILSTHTGRISHLAVVDDVYASDDLASYVVGNGLAHAPLEWWARTVGKENLLVGNDCGFASTAGNAEIPPTVAWAKLQALSEGASLASERLY